jgi:hypothetical protein
MKSCPDGLQATSDQFGDVDCSKPLQDFILNFIIFKMVMHLYEIPALQTSAFFKFGMFPAIKTAEV